MHAYVQIAADPDKEANVLEALRAMPEVKEAHVVFGEWDLIVRVECASPEELGRFVVSNLRPLDGIKNTKTLIVAK